MKAFRSPARSAWPSPMRWSSISSLSPSIPGRRRLPLSAARRSAMLCDPKYRDQMVKRGDDPEKLAPLYADLINTAMLDIPSDMTITMHLCRGNYKSTFMGAGSYDAVQEILFNKINVHGYFMEYDDERSGGFEPLRMLPKGKTV